MSSSAAQPLNDAPRVLIARQPILDRKQQPMGYALLWRSSASPDAARFDDADIASASVLLRACVDMGLEQLAGNLPVFVHVTRRLLLEDRFLPARGERIVLELERGTVLDTHLLAKLRELNGRGFGLAMDDCAGQNAEGEMGMALAPLVTHVKVDVQQPTGGTPLPALVSRLRAHPLQLIAKKVETYEQFDRCHELGFDGFQGYYLFRPELTDDVDELPGSRMAVLRLLAVLQDADAEPEQIEQVLVADAALSYKLLRLVNSAFFGLRTQVQSIRHAIVFLGMQRVRQWAQMLAIGKLEDRPPDLMKAALVRARTLELLAGEAPVETQAHAFTVGLFSLLDALLGAPLPQLLENLPIAEPVRVALLRREGALARDLGDFEQYETLNWNRLHPKRLIEVGGHYVDAVVWAEQSYASLRA